MLEKDKQDECLNSLRVASKEWPGFVHYQGLTTKTALCPLDTAAMSRQRANRSKLAKTSYSMHRSRFSSSHDSQSNMAMPPKDDNKTLPVKQSTNKTIVDGEIDDDDKSENKHLNSRLSTLIPKSASVDSSNSVSSAKSSDSNSTNQGHPEKSCLSLPSVSCNELPSTDDLGLDALTNHRALKKTPHTMVFSVNGQTQTRPHTAGPRMIIPPKHTCPEGLTSNDFIQGQGLSQRERPQTSHCDIANEDTEINDQDTTTSCYQPAPKPRSFLQSDTDKPRYDYEEGGTALYSRRPEMNQGFRGFRRPLTRSSAVEERVVSLELTITAINPACRGNEDSDSETKDSPTSHDKSPSTENETKTSAENNPNSDSLNPPSTRIDTIEGIKKSYHRAKSAPPTHGRSHISGSSSVEQTGNSEVKQFSNLYYRAKSAYHKRQESGAAEDVEPSKDRSQTPAISKGSLLRPLLYANDQGPMKHGVGCPYKCKGCFKACLVSQDYVQKALERTLQEQRRNQQQTRTHSALAKRANLPAPLVNKCFASMNIVSRALGRSQPLFHQVYGRGKGQDGRKIPMKPWPRYGWVDLTARKQELNDLSSDYNANQKSNDNVLDGT